MSEDDLFQMRHYGPSWEKADEPLRGDTIIEIRPAMVAAVICHPSDAADVYLVGGGKVSIPHAAAVDLLNFIKNGGDDGQEV